MRQKTPRGGKTKVKKTGKTAKPARAKPAATARRGGGGPAAVGGFNFQAAVTAIALTHLGAGLRLGWLDGLAEDIPAEIRSETGGAGDDLRILTTSGQNLEVQVKKGLTSGSVLRDLLDALAGGLKNGDFDFGVIVVCPMSSRTVSNGLAHDLIAMAGDEHATVGDEAADFRTRLRVRGFSVQAICGALRIVTAHALAVDNAGVQAAQALLVQLTGQTSQAQPAWLALYADAAAMMASRGVRRIGDIVRRLRAAGVAFAPAARSSAAAVARLAGQTAEAYRTLTLIGVRRPLSIDDAWIRTPVLQFDPNGSSALADQTPDAYYRWRPPSERDNSSDADALGVYYRHAVVVAGPGMGKSTLTRRLARRFSLQTYPVLRVEARKLAAALARGSALESALFDLGLDGSGLAASDLAGVEDWVLLMDGLDETGPWQDQIAEGLTRIKAARPNARIIATTRPIGYRTGRLSDWRHYGLSPTGSGDVLQALKQLLELIDPACALLTETEDFETSVDLSADVKSVMAESPMMVGLGAALLSRGRSLGGSRVELFTQIIDMIEASPPRAIPAPFSSAILRRALILFGHQVVTAPLQPQTATIDAVGRQLALDLGQAHLQGVATAEVCLDYWRELGLVETVHHQAEPTVTFVHLAFAEYCAGRFVAALPDAEREASIRRLADDDRWLEVLEFAGTSGAGAPVVRALLDRTDGRRSLEAETRILRIASMAGSELPPDTLAAVLSALEDALTSDDPGRAQGAASAALALAVASPEQIRALAELLTTHDQAWTRLAGWALLASAGLRAEEIDAAAAALKALSDPALTLGSLPSHLPTTGSNALIQVFALPVFTRLYQSRPVEEVDLFVEVLIKRPRLNTYGFYRDLMPVLKRAGSTINPMKRDRGFSNINVDFKAFGQAAQRAYGAIYGALLFETPIQTLPAPVLPGRWQIHTGAFNKLSGLDKTAVSDVWNWAGDPQSEIIRAVLQGLVSVSPIPYEGLVAEIVAATRSREEEDAFNRYFGRTLHSDTPPIDWSAADRSRVDLRRLEQGVSHRSSFIATLAATLLDEFWDQDERRAGVERLLGARGPHAGELACQLAGGLPPETAGPLLLTNLSADHPDARARLEALTRLEWSAAFAGLDWPALICARDAHTATAAATLLLKAPQDTAGMEAIVFAAWSHWKAHEAPYPTQGGVVPPSPRARLFELRARLGLSLDQLLAEGSDSRSDVADAVGAALESRLAASAQDRQIFARRIGESALPLRLLSRIVRSSIRFSSGELEDLAGGFGSPEADYRRAMLSLFEDKTATPPDFREAWLTRLRKDPDPQVRQTAAERLAQRETRLARTGLPRLIE